MSLASDRQSCIISLLPSSSFEAKETLEGVIENFEDKQLRLTSFLPLKIFRTVAVEHEDSLFLGEVLACTPRLAGEWTLLISVKQRLTSLQSLLRLREQLLQTERCFEPTTKNSVSLAG